MAFSMGGGSAVKSEPNVVPMIDVMLVLLIIFMLIIPQISAGFTATPPEGANLKNIFDAEGRDEFILYVKADRNLKYDQVLEAIDVAAKNGVRVTGMITEQDKMSESVVEQSTGGD